MLWECSSALIELSAQDTIMAFHVLLFPFSIVHEVGDNIFKYVESQKDIFVAT